MTTVDDAMELELAAHSSANVMLTARHVADRAAWARTIHDRSGRSDGAFVAVCGETLPAVAGARSVDRWFRRAAGGTLFIDRIGDLSARAQERLLALITRHSPGHDGAPAHRAVHPVRIIAGSDRSLRPDLAVGSFSDTLFYRLNVIHIDLMRPGALGQTPMKVRDLMSAPAYTCGPNTDLATVAKIMWDRDCGFVPVVEGLGVVTGVVTDRDICMAMATRRLLAEQLQAGQVMASPTHVCMPDDSVSDVLVTMRQCRIRRLPVLDGNGRLQGVISLNDIVLASTEQKGPQTSDVIATMAAICAHRVSTQRSPDRARVATGICSGDGDI